MWRSFFPLLQHLWIAAREEEEGGSNHSHFFLTNTQPPPSSVHAIKEGANIEKKYLIQYLAGETGTQAARYTDRPNDIQQPTTSEKLNTFMKQFVDFQARAISLAHDKKEESEKAERWQKRMNVKTLEFLLFASVSTNPVVPDCPKSEYKTMLDNNKDQALLYLQACIIIHRNGTQVVDTNLALLLWNGFL